jgi:hypothetical protein
LSSNLLRLSSSLSRLFKNSSGILDGGVDGGAVGLGFGRRVPQVYPGRVALVALARLRRDGQ